jgi:hypothetical protein
MARMIPIKRPADRNKPYIHQGKTTGMNTSLLPAASVLVLTITKTELISKNREVEGYGSGSIRTNPVEARPMGCDVQTP